MEAIRNFLELVNAWCAGTGRSEARLSSILFNDGKRIRMLREGRDMGSRTLETAILSLSANWPDGAVWPNEVPRPAVNLNPQGPAVHENQRLEISQGHFTKVPA